MLFQNYYSRGIFTYLSSFRFFSRRVTLSSSFVFPVFYSYCLSLFFSIVHPTDLGCCRWLLPQPTIKTSHHKQGWKDQHEHRHRAPHSESELEIRRGGVHFRATHISLVFYWVNCGYYNSVGPYNYCQKGNFWLARERSTSTKDKYYNPIYLDGRVF